MTRSILKTLGLIRVTFIACVGFSLSIAASARAQEPATSAASAAPGRAGTEATAERVIVTGSNIPTAEEVGLNPVFNLNRDLINKSGQSTTVEELLKTQPVMNASGIPVSNNANASGGPTGTASVSLRGFDPGATLVLVDGRRVTPFPGNANSGAGFEDLLTLPITAVQSIEILKDGASTTYGADAVAGVVNLKLYKDYRGAQLTLYYGDTLDKDAGLYSGHLLFGTGDDKVSIETIGFFTIFIPPHAPIAAGAEPPGTPTAAQVSAPAGAFNPFNPFNQFISGGSRARIADFGNRLFDNENEAWLSTIGVKGDKLFDGSWGYDAGFRYSQILSINQIRDVNGPRFERILNANDSIFNPASSDFIGQTIPYNPFNDFKVPIKSNLPLINFATLLPKKVNLDDHFDRSKRWN
jgi:hypothetical protein